ncbi:WYL domain-containing protein [Desulfuromonas sp. AOP6]|uniref:helix-turn-helix transcriptional regulator n=1 Tax=Desulfuromonas sp. AOP6 TaxID=1566351 RepID=UPI001274E95F|nr:WYL domain-containing protein [Desulfuromonas sp. AOP6]BCA79948.1 WYL domain-containing protein [Desulfuromonas sp. AOP6]
MVDHLVFERYRWFDAQIRNDKYPNASSLARQFEICQRTAQRTIEKMRDRLGAPLEYDAARKGYFYPESSFSLPQLLVSQNELLAILLARNLLSQSAGGIISESIASFGKKLLGQTGEFGLGEKRLGEAFSAIWNGYSPADGQVFQTIATALLQPHTLAFRYYSPARDQWNERTADPYHLQHYNGSWILLAWCHLRQCWRKFSLSRVEMVKSTGQTFIPLPKDQWWSQVQGTYGIFQDGEVKAVLLRFSPFRARWLSRELWHSQQETWAEPDGTLYMRLAVADFREIKLRIMQYGADVEVLEPAELRAEILTEIGRMYDLYKKCEK